MNWLSQVQSRKDALECIKKSKGVVNLLLQLDIFNEIFPDKLSSLYFIDDIRFYCFGDYQRINNESIKNIVDKELNKFSADLGKLEFKLSLYSSSYSIKNSINCELVITNDQMINLNQCNIPIYSDTISVMIREITFRLFDKFLKIKST